MLPKTVTILSSFEEGNLYLFQVATTCSPGLLSSLTSSLSTIKEEQCSQSDQVTLDDPKNNQPSNSSVPCTASSSTVSESLDHCDSRTRTLEASSASEVKCDSRTLVEIASSSASCNTPATRTGTSSFSPIDSGCELASSSTSSVDDFNRTLDTSSDNLDGPVSSGLSSTRRRGPSTPPLPEPSKEDYELEEGEYISGDEDTQEPSASSQVDHLSSSTNGQCDSSANKLCVVSSAGTSSHESVVSCSDTSKSPAHLADNCISSSDSHIDSSRLSTDSVVDSTSNHQHDTSGVSSSYHFELHNGVESSSSCMDETSAFGTSSNVSSSGVAHQEAPTKKKVRY